MSDQPSANASSHRMVARPSFPAFFLAPHRTHLQSFRVKEPQTMRGPPPLLSETTTLRRSSHFKEKGRPLQSFIQARSSALNDSIGRGIERLKGRPALVLPIAASANLLGRNTRGGTMEVHHRSPAPRSFREWVVKMTRKLLNTLRAALLRRKFDDGSRSRRGLLEKHPQKARGASR